MMTWACDQKRDARDYRNPDERKAFNAGYSDGFHGYAQFASNDRDWYPNAYSAGYWEGKADKP